MQDNAAKGASMEVDAKFILESVFNIAPSESLECQACQAAIYAYIDAELNSQDATARFPEVATHLQVCAPCREAYEELKTILSAECQDALANPPATPDFDFDYLEGSSQSPSIWQVVKAAGKQTAELLSAIRIGIGRQNARFVGWPPSLTPSLIPAAATRSNIPASAHGVQSLSIASPEGDLQIGIIIGSASNLSTTLGAKVVESVSRQPRQRVRITLRDAVQDESNLLASELTDQKGEVTFVDVAPGSYYLDVKYHGHTLRLPLVLVQDKKE